MKTKLLKLTIVTTVLSIVLLSETSNAQFQNMVSRVKTTTQKISGKPSSADSSGNTATNKNSKKLVIHSNFDFVAGDSVLFNQNFMNSVVGRFPSSLKTNGSGKIVTIDGLDGRWLELEDGSSYKIAKLLNLPSKFTIEYDLVVIADQTIDLDPFIFGFTVDNSVRSYIQDAYNNGGICTVTLLYFNKNQVNVSSSKTKSYFNTTFDLVSYANRVMHVSMAADGDQLTVYLDKTKIVDSQLFKGDLSKYFFFSAPLGSKNGAKIAISNLNVRMFKY